MNWYYKFSRDHVRVRVFMNGANCGELCFRVGEFHEIRRRALQASPFSPIFSFINETEKD